MVSIINETYYKDFNLNNKNKIIHLSDIHIRTGNFERSRYNEYMFVFKNLINSLKLIRNFDKYIIVITGDIFHNKSQIESSGISLFTYLINELTKLTQVFLIMGNHDYRQEYINEPDLLSALLGNNELINTQSNLFYLKKTGIYIVGDILFGLVAINDTLIAGDTSGKVDNLPEFPDCSNYDKKYKVALYHGIIIDDNNSFFSNKNIGINVDWFKSYNFAILGDVHSQQVNNSKLIDGIYEYNDINNTNDTNNTQNIIWGYSGSLIQQNFGESIDKHGYLIWDFDNNKVIPHEVENKNAYCTLKYTDNWYIKINHNKKPYILFEQFINDYKYFKNLNIRLLNNTSNENTLQLIKLLNENNINYNSFFYNNILQTDLQVDASDNIIENSGTTNNDKIEYILSFNKLETWFNLIQQNIDNNNLDIGDYDWKNMIYNLEKLKINSSNIPDTLKKNVEDRNKKISKQISIYNDTREDSNNIKSSLNLIYMEWEWILCFKDNCWFNFKNMKSNVTLLNADNGCGKSSFLEIICLILFGSSFPSRFNKTYSSSIICFQKPKGSRSKIKLVFEWNNKKYLISKTFEYQVKDKNKLKTNPELFILNNFNDNEDNLVKLHSGSEVDKWITSHIGNIDSFLLASIYTQNSDNDFFSMKYKDQMNLLDKALSITPINELLELFKQVQLSYKDIIIRIEAIYMESCQNVEVIEKETLEDFKRQYLESKSNLDILQKDLLDKINEISSIINISDIDKKYFTKDDNEINDIIKNLKIEIGDDIEDINNYYSKQGELKSEINKYLKLFQQYNINIKNDIRNDSGSCILFDNYGSYSGQDNLSLNINYDEIRKITFKDIIKEDELIKTYFLKHSNVNEDLDNLKQKYESNNEIFEKNSIFIADKQKVKNSNNDKLKLLYKKQRKLPNIELKISECKNNIDKFNKIKDKLQKKQNLLNKNLDYLKLLDDNNNKLVIIEEDISKLINLIDETKNKDYPFNPNCECCKKQPWKIHLDNLEKKLNNKINEKNIIEKELEENKINISYEDLQKNIKKIQDWIEVYNELNENYDYYQEQIDTINQYNSYDKEIKELEKIDIDINKEIKNKSKENNIIISDNKFLEKNIKICDEYSDWVNRDNKNINNKKWLDYFINKEYSDYVKLLNEKEEIDKIINNNNENIKKFKKIEFWNNLKLVRPLWNEHNEIQNNIKIKTDLFNKQTHKYITLKKSYDIYVKINEKNIKIKLELDKLKKQNSIIESFSNIFTDYRINIYNKYILPLIIQNTNSIMKTISKDSNLLLLDVAWNKDVFNWKLIDGKNNINIEKSSGYQRFAIGLAMRITLSNLGISNIKCRQLFIDEGFTSCDQKHLSKMPLFINSLLHLYDSILIVSHLQEIKESVTISLDIKRDIEKSLSYLNYGNKYTITSNKILTNNDN